MLNNLHTLAKRVRGLRIPALVVGFSSLITIIVTLLSSSSHEEDRLLMPSFALLLWATSLYTLIEGFGSIPAKPSAGAQLHRRISQRIKRAWFWFLGAVFLAATAVAILLSYRLVSIWLDEYI